jgi:hypothetical protein
MGSGWSTIIEALFLELMLVVCYELTGLGNSKNYESGF